VKEQLLLRGKTLVSGKQQLYRAKALIAPIILYLILKSIKKPPLAGFAYYLQLVHTTNPQAAASD